MVDGWSRTAMSPTNPAAPRRPQQFNKGVTQTIEGLEGMSKYLTAAAKASGDTAQPVAAGSSPERPP
jgi:hypothetical protein